MAKVFCVKCHQAVEENTHHTWGGEECNAEVIKLDTDENKYKAIKLITERTTDLIIKQTSELAIQISWQNSFIEMMFKN
jgi:hypothetical protein